MQLMRILSKLDNVYFSFRIFKCCQTILLPRTMLADYSVPRTMLADYSVTPHLVRGPELRTIIK